MKDVLHLKAVDTHNMSVSPVASQKGTYILSVYTKGDIENVKIEIPYQILADLIPEMHRKFAHHGTNEKDSEVTLPTA